MARAPPVSRNAGFDWLAIDSRRPGVFCCSCIDVFVMVRGENFGETSKNTRVKNQEASMATTTRAAGMDRGETLRLAALGFVVLLEGGAVISAVLRAQVPLCVFIYPNILSVAVFVLPTVVGLLSRRLEVAILFAILPFWALALVYLAIFAPVWNVDLFQLGILASRVGGSSVLLGVLGSLGWMLRRVLRGGGLSS